MGQGKTLADVVRGDNPAYRPKGFLQRLLEALTRKPYQPPVIPPRG